MASNGNAARTHGTTTTTMVTTAVTTTTTHYTRVLARAVKGATLLPRPARASGAAAVGVGVNVDAKCKGAVFELQCVGTAYAGVRGADELVVDAKLVTADGKALDGGCEITNAATAAEVAPVRLRVTLDKEVLALPVATQGKLDSVAPLVLTLTVTARDSKRVLSVLGVDVWGMKRTCITHFNEQHHGTLLVETSEDSHESA